MTQGPETTRIIGPGTLPPDRFARRPLPPPPSLEERRVQALEEIAAEMSRIRRVLDYGNRR